MSKFAELKKFLQEKEIEGYDQSHEGLLKLFIDVVSESKWASKEEMVNCFKYESSVLFNKNTEEKRWNDMSIIKYIIRETFGRDGIFDIERNGVPVGVKEEKDCLYSSLLGRALTLIDASLEEKRAEHMKSILKTLFNAQKNRFERMCYEEANIYFNNK